MNLDEIPAELVEIGAKAHEEWHLDNCTDPASEIYWSSHEAWVQATLAAVLPEVLATVANEARLCASHVGHGLPSTLDAATLTWFAERIYARPRWPMNELIAELTACRVRKQWTKKATAARVGVRTTTLARWESGEREPTITYLQQWANALGLTARLVPTEPEGALPVCEQQIRAKIADEIENANPATIWADDEELANFPDRDLTWWMNTLGHPTAHTGCCATCGCATPCTASVFADALTSSLARIARGDR